MHIRTSRSRNQTNGCGERWKAAPLAVLPLTSLASAGSWGKMRSYWMIVGGVDKREHFSTGLAAVVGIVWLEREPQIPRPPRGMMSEGCCFDPGWPRGWDWSPLEPL